MMEQEVIEDYVQAGKIAKQVVEFAKGLIKPGMKLLEIADRVEEKIIGLGGGIAFPVNLSLNEVAAHYAPSSSDEKIAEGLLKVDIGVEINGYIADTAFSLDLTEDKKYTEMIGTNEKALANVLKKLNSESVVSDVADLLHEISDETDFLIINNLSGHSLSQYQVHSGTTISNYVNSNYKELKDMVIAIEPFFTTGRGEVYEAEHGEIFMLENEEKQVRNPDARKLLDFIKENYKTKPFCRRWLEKKGFAKLNFLFGVLINEGVLYNFPVLVEKDKAPVSQAEHTVLFSDKVLVTTM